MAVATSPTLTSTSHTLSGQPLMPPASSSGVKPSPDVDTAAFLANLRPDNRHKFIEPDADISSDSLNIVKDTLEAFASQVGHVQQQRLKESRKRKRSGERSLADGDVLKLRKVYIDGFETVQVWQQAKKIIGGVVEFANGLVDEMEGRGEVVEDSGSEAGARRNVSFEKERDEGDEGDVNGQIDLGDGGDNADEGDNEIEDQQVLEYDSDEIVELQSGSEEEEEGEEEEEVIEEEKDEDEDEDEEENQVDEFVQDANGLNDGFFSIDAFNKQTQWFEDQDARGDPTTDQATDDEEVDWGADPLAPPKSKAKSSDKKGDRSGAPLDEAFEGVDDEEDGPTFGDMALDAPEGASEDEAMDMDNGVEDDEGNEFNANEVYYKDFFAPPPRKSKPGGKSSKNRVVKTEAETPNEEDIQRAMANVKRDLFQDDTDNEDSDDNLSDVSAGDPKSRRSAHERRQAKLAEEIRQLEAASVAKREWTLSGEAAAADRPMNSLLEQDLDFEHVGKPVPVITPQVSESIEDLIKRRILSQEFDEVLRRRPDTDGIPANTRRGLVEVDDSKSTKGLAEVYEEEHVKKANPDTYVSKSDEKLKKEEKEVEALWRDVSARLDALSSWHFKPKPAAPTLSVISDLPTISMEDAQPTTAQALASESSRMAPQEIYKASATTLPEDQVLTKTGMPLSRQELSREDKTRRRRRNKERLRKAGGDIAKNKTRLGTRAKMQRDTMAELKKGGVKVINRRGEITDVHGNKAMVKKGLGNGSFKL